MKKILLNIPHQGDNRSLSKLRSSLRNTPQDPSRSVPAHLSPPYVSNRTRPSSDTGGLSQAGKGLQLENGISRQPSYDAPSSYPLAIHLGPPRNSSPASYSPYMNQPDSQHRYQSTAPHSSFQSRQGESSGLPIPPNFNQSNTLNGHSSSYDSSRGYSNGEAHHGDVYYSTPLLRAPQYHSSSSTYASAPCDNEHYANQNGSQYHWPVQFESKDITSQGRKKRRGNLPRDATDLLKQWIEEHLAHPYPTEEEKQMLCRLTGLAMTQVSTTTRTLGMS